MSGRLPNKEGGKKRPLTSFRIPKLSKEKKEEPPINAFNEEVLELLSFMNSIKKDCNSMSDDNKKIIAEVSTQPDPEPIDAEQLKRENEEKKEKAQQRLMEEVVGQFAILENAVLACLESRSEFANLVNSIQIKVECIFSTAQFKKLATFTSPGRMSVYLARSVMKEPMDMKLALYPVLVCHLATTIYDIYNTAEPEDNIRRCKIHMSWSQLQTLYGTFLSQLNVKVNPLYLLVSIYESLRQIVQQSGSRFDLAYFYVKVMPIYVCIFEKVAKQKLTIGFTEENETVIGLILVYIFGFQILLNYANENKNGFSLPDSISLAGLSNEHMLMKELLSKVASCCTFEMGNAIAKFTHLLVDYLKDKPMKFTLDLWLDLIKVLPMEMGSTTVPHVLYLVTKRIYLFLGNPQPLEPIKTSLASYDDVEQQLPLIIDHLNRDLRKSLGFNELYHLMTMLYYAPKTVQQDDLKDLYNLVKWLEEHVKKSGSQSRVMLFQTEAYLSQRGSLGRPGILRMLWKVKPNILTYSSSGNSSSVSVALYYAVSSLFRL